MFSKKCKLAAFVIIFTMILFYGAIGYADDPDTQAPSVPTNIVVSDVTSTSVTLTWDASTDNVAVVGYDVIMGDTLLASVANLTYNITSLEPGTEYTITLVSKDAAGNRSDDCIESFYTCLVAPSNITVNKHTKAIDISWDSVDKARGGDNGT